MKKNLLIALITLLIFTLVGCQSKQESAASLEQAQSESSLSDSIQSAPPAESTPLSEESSQASEAAETWEDSDSPIDHSYLELLDKNYKEIEDELGKGILYFDTHYGAYGTFESPDGKLTSVNFNYDIYKQDYSESEIFTWMAEEFTIDNGYVNKGYDFEKGKYSKEDFPAKSYYLFEDDLLGFFKSTEPITLTQLNELFGENHQPISNPMTSTYETDRYKYENYEIMAMLNPEDTNIVSVIMVEKMS